MKIEHVAAAAALALCCMLPTTHAAAAGPEKTCQEAVNAAKVEWAAKYVAPAPAPADAKTPPLPNNAPAPNAAAPDPTVPPSPQITDVSLDNDIEVGVSNLAGLYPACSTSSTSRLVLFLNGYPIKSLVPMPSTNPGDGRLRFKLSVSDSSRRISDSADAAKKAADARQSWTPVIGQPGFSPRAVEVSIGPEDGYAAKSNAAKATLYVDILWNIGVLIWGIIFLAMLAIFFGLALCTNILRDGNPTPVPANANAPAVPVTKSGPYSLSKTQGAWWFFIILAAYLFIGIVTGDFTNSLNSTALILLGIGAGTVIAAALIDKAKDTQDTANVQTASILAQTNLAAANAAVAATQAQITAAAPAGAPAAVAALQQQLSALTADRDKKQSVFLKLTQQNEQFLIDILSDADGISFHRFQMAAWTLVLGIIFASSAYYNLAMPIFDTTLMGLLGLSAGTYLGLKIPEAATPK